jgi:glycosyltransferase involved in cell wall biosynthesis
VSYISFALASLFGLAILGYRPQVIYVYNLVTLMPVAAIARWRWESRVVLDVQDLWPESITASGLTGGRQIPHLLSTICDKAYRSADAVIAQSPGFSLRLRQRGVDPSRITVIYNWALREYSAARLSVDSQTRSFRVVYAGNIGRVQGLNVIVDVAARLAYTDPRVQFVIVGTGSEFDLMQAAISKLPNVEILGQLSPDKLEPILLGASALLLHLSDDPLFRITIPSKLQQYLQVGRPILCGVAGDASNLVEAAKAGISFIPGDSEALFAAIKQLLSLPNDTLERLGQNGMTYYKKHLTQEQGMRRIASVISANVA